MADQFDMMSARIVIELTAVTRQVWTCAGAVAELRLHEELSGARTAARTAAARIESELRKATMTLAAEDERAQRAEAEAGRLAAQLGALRARGQTVRR